MKKNYKSLKWSLFTYEAAVFFHFFRGKKAFRRYYFRKLFNFNMSKSNLVITQDISGEFSIKLNK